jgi:hypothetical protein
MVYGGCGGGITPCIINFGTISKWVVSYMPQLLYLKEISSDTHWVGHHVGPRARLDVTCNNMLPVVGSKPQFLSCPACVSLTVLAGSLAMYFLLFDYRSCITGYICMSHNPVSIFIYCLCVLWTATHMPMFTNVAVQSSSALYDGNTCKEAILLTFLRIIDAVWKEVMLWLVYLDHAKVCGTNLYCHCSFYSCSL